MTLHKNSYFEPALITYFREESSIRSCENNTYIPHNGAFSRCHRRDCLLRHSGCRGMAIGAAQMSDKHCNFMLNTGGATAAELERLGELVRQKVKEFSAQDLEWEIIRIGKAA